MGGSLLGPCGSKSPATSGGVTTVEGGFLCPMGGILHDGGIATMDGGWLGPEGDTLPRGNKFPTTLGGIVEYGRASATVAKSDVSSFSATTTTIDGVAASAMLFLLLVMVFLWFFLLLFLWIFVHGVYCGRWKFGLLYIYSRA